MRSPDAEELWRRFGAGDGSAFSRLYRDHQHDVVRYCRSLLRDEEDAHDAAQGTWAAIWSRPDAARRDVPLRPWLFRVAHNEAVSIIRRRRPQEPLVDLELPALDDVASDVELRDRLATLRADLMNLPERQRVALLSRELGGLGHAEIADALGISTAVAKQTIYEARRALVEAESGRTMACEQVQRALSDGDGRVRRGRRLSAHLRGCAGCRTFADAVGRRRRDLRLLFPAPAALGLLARVGAGLGAGGAGAGGGLAAAGGSAATKLAVAAALTTAVGVGGHHEIARVVHGEAKGATAERGPVRAATPRRSSGTIVSVAAPLPASRARSSAGTTPVRKPRADRGKPAPGPAPAASPRVAPPPPPAAGPARGGPAATRPTPPRSETPPGLAKKPAAAAPPGQAKKTDVPEPPGQAKKPAATEPPGQAKKTDAATPPAPADVTSAPAPADTAPGQAKAHVPPGQAKK